MNEITFFYLLTNNNLTTKQIIQKSTNTSWSLWGICKKCEFSWTRAYTFLFLCTSVSSVLFFLNKAIKQNNFTLKMTPMITLCSVKCESHCHTLSKYDDKINKAITKLLKTCMMFIINWLLSGCTIFFLQYSLQTHSKPACVHKDSTTWWRSGCALSEIASIFFSRKGLIKKWS